MPKKALLIIAQKDYQDQEYERTRAALERGALEIAVAGGQGGTCNGRFGGTVQGVLPLAQVNAMDYAIVAFIGGGGAEAYVRDPEALRIANEAARAEVILGALCIAPLILAKAKVLEAARRPSGMTAEARRSGSHAGRSRGDGDSATVDGRIVTGTVQKPRGVWQTLVELVRL